MVDRLASLPALTLVVETPNGMYVRRIPNASPLLSGIEQGEAAEHATRAAVARWGLPDFVYRPLVHKLGSGTRELGDALLLVGHRAVVVQVKSRHAAGQDVSREENWIRKNVARALRQAQGTVRSLRSAPHAMVNLRDRQININGKELDWLAVIIIDHSDVPNGLTVGNLQSELPAIVLLRRDWEFLFDQLRSTHAVVDYLHRAVSDASPIKLGEEPVRYYTLAQADAEAPPGNSEIAFSPGGRRVSTPLLPLAPAGHDDTQAHLLLRAVMEDIALTPIPDSVTENDRILVLAELDELPVGHRAELGRAMFEMMRQVAEAPKSKTAWRFRRIRAEREKPHLMFGVCNKEHNEFINEAFVQLVMLRHHEYCSDIGGIVDDVRSVGVLLTPRPRSTRPWDTTMVHAEGDLRLTRSELEGIRNFWSL